MTGVAVKTYGFEEHAQGELSIRAFCVVQDKEFIAEEGLTSAEADMVEGAYCPYCKVVHALYWQSEAVKAGLLRPVG